MKTLFRILGTAAAVAVTGAAIVVLDKILNQKDPLHVEEVEFPEDAEKDAEEAEKTAEAYAEAEAKEEAKAADAAAEAAEEAAPEAPAPAEDAPQTQPETAEERPVYDPEAPNANPVEAGPAVHQAFPIIGVCHGAALHRCFFFQYSELRSILQAQKKLPLSGELISASMRGSCCFLSPCSPALPSRRNRWHRRS